MTTRPMRWPASPCSAPSPCSSTPRCKACCISTDAAYGLWVGSSVHEVAQAVFAAAQGSHQVAYVGTIAKLTRVAMMAR